MIDRMWRNTRSGRDDGGTPSTEAAHPRDPQFEELAHDLNTMMTVVSAAAHLCAQCALDADQRRLYAGAITEATTRASQLTRQMLDLAGGRRQAEGTFDVGQSVMKAACVMRLLAGPQIELHVLAPEGPSRVTADVHQFEAALVNLVINARDAIDHFGRICISADLMERDGRRQVAVTVADNGRGIAVEQRDRIFEPPFTTKGAGGCGLGLPQVVRFVRQAGGDLAVHSSPGMGSMFQLCLPLADVDEFPIWQSSNFAQVIEVVARHLD